MKWRDRAQACLRPFSVRPESPPMRLETLYSLSAWRTRKRFLIQSDMPNPGYPEVRAALAAQLSKEQGLPIAASDLLLTCGAAGGINVFFRAVLTPGDEVICPAPYFVEYDFYVGNHGGILKAIPTKPDTFELDIPALEAAITPRTRVLMPGAEAGSKAAAKAAAKKKKEKRKKRKKR